MVRVKMAEALQKGRRVVKWIFVDDGVGSELNENRVILHFTK